MVMIKVIVTASAIVDDILTTVDSYYRYSDNSFLKPGQMVWHAVPIDEFPAKGKSIYQTALKPVVLDIISDSDIEDMKKPLHHREIRLKRVERWTQQAFEQGALLTQLDLAVLLSVNEFTAGQLCSRISISLWQNFTYKRQHSADWQRTNS